MFFTVVLVESAVEVCMRNQGSQSASHEPDILNFTKVLKGIKKQEVLFLELDYKQKNGSFDSSCSSLYVQTVQMCYG